MAHQLLQISAKLVDLLLNLCHPFHLNVEFVVNTIDLHLDLIEQFAAARRLCASRASHATHAFFPGLPRRSWESFGSTLASLADWATRSDIPGRAGGTRSSHWTRRAWRPGRPGRPGDTL